MLVSEAELLHLILAGITGALILFLSLFSIFYFSQVKGAERERDEAITLAPKPWPREIPRKPDLQR